MNNVPIPGQGDDLLMNELGFVKVQIDSLNKYYTGLLDKEQKLREALQKHALTFQRFENKIDENPPAYAQLLGQPSQLQTFILPQGGGSFQQKSMNPPPVPVGIQNSPQILNNQVLNPINNNNNGIINNNSTNVQSQPNLMLATQPLNNNNNNIIPNNQGNNNILNNQGNNNILSNQGNNSNPNINPLTLPSDRIENQLTGSPGGYNENQGVSDIDQQSIQQIIKQANFYMEENQKLKLQLEQHQQQRDHHHRQFKQVDEKHGAVNQQVDDLRKANLNLQDELRDRQRQHDEFIVKQYRVLEQRVQELVEENEILKQKGQNVQQNVNTGFSDKIWYENECRRLQGIIIRLQHELDELRSKPQQNPFGNTSINRGSELIAQERLLLLHVEIERLSQEDPRDLIVKNQQLNKKVAALEAQLEKANKSGGITKDMGDNVRVINLDEYQNNSELPLRNTANDRLPGSDHETFAEIVGQRDLLQRELRRVKGALQVKISENEQLTRLLESGGGGGGGITMSQYNNQSGNDQRAQLLGLENIKLKTALINANNNSNDERIQALNMQILKLRTALSSALNNGNNTSNIFNNGNDERVQALNMQVNRLRTALVQAAGQSNQVFTNNTMDQQSEQALREANNRIKILSGQLEKLNDAYYQEKEECDKLKQLQYQIQGKLKNNLGALAQTMKDTETQQNIFGSELEKVTLLLREKSKENEELRSAVMQFEGILQEQIQYSEQMTLKVNQLGAALNQRGKADVQIREQDQRILQMNGEIEKLAGALKQKMREIDMLQLNFNRLENYTKEREVIENEFKKLKQVLEIKLQECQELRERCKQYEHKMVEMAKMDEKLKSTEAQLAGLVQNIHQMTNFS